MLGRTSETVAKKILIGMVHTCISVLLSNNKLIAMWEQSGSEKKKGFGESRLEKKKKKRKQWKEKNQAKG